MTFAAHGVMLALNCCHQWEVKVVDNRNSGYGSHLELFVEPTCDSEIARLRLLRWLTERNFLDHRPVDFFPARCPCERPFPMVW